MASKIRPEFKEELKRKKEAGVLLVLAFLLGILANLIANIIEGILFLDKNYPLIYILIILVLSFFMIYFFINYFPFIKIYKIFYEHKRLSKKYKKRITSKKKSK
jgi:uncharacterized protein YacL